MALVLRCRAFRDGEPIPREHTCEGEDLSPELAWSGVPAGAKSLALIVEDPDAPDPAAPKKTFTHWVVYDIPPGARELARDIRDEDGLPEGGRMGTNDYRKMAWGGPCPPRGRHRYFFRLFALDTTLPNLVGPTRRELLAAIDGHVMEEATLMGTYELANKEETLSPP